VALIDTVADLLDEADIKYENKTERSLDMVWSTDHFESLKVRIITSENETWVYIVAWFTPISDISPEDRETFYYQMLKENWERNGVKFAIDGDDNLVISAEIADMDLEPDEIKRYILTVLNASDRLYEIYPRSG